MSLINAFNNLLDDFLVDLQKAFPNEHYLKTFYNAFLLIKKSHPKQNIYTFMSYIGPYADRIKNCDTDFFLQLADTNETTNEDYLNKGLRLKHLWLHPDTTDHTKACIISYTQNLLKIGERAI
jgi:hypothetical protein